MDETERTIIIHALDRADFCLASNTPRDGCVYKPVDLQCSRCKPILSARKAIKEAWNVLDAGTPWWKHDPQKRYED